MNPTRPLVIHKLLPSEIMGIIFEEHTKLEWNAPAIDGRVCRTWRQIILNTPRAWIYLEINDEEQPRLRDLREWLDRSGSAPLYIRVSKGTTADRPLYQRPMDDLLSGYHSRIASLRLPYGDSSFFERREFPCLRLLDINRWYPMGPPSRPVQWDSMLALQSLRLAATQTETFPLQWSELPQLEALTLYSARLTSLPQCPRSLTTLMLDNVSVGGSISSPIDFPSLTYLSLYRVFGLKPYINTPCLVTYHEGWGEESFPSPIPSLEEYGVCSPSRDVKEPSRWHRSFPNMLRLCIRGPPLFVIPVFRSLSDDPHSLPALQTISVGTLSVPITEEEKAIIRALVRVRGDACHADVMLYFDTKRPFQIPIFFGGVSHCLSYDL
jgi:hypothetical protein